MKAYIFIFLTLAVQIYTAKTNMKVLQQAKKVCLNSFINCENFEAALNSFRSRPYEVVKKLENNYLNKLGDTTYNLKQKLEFDKGWKKEAWNSYYYQGPENVMETQYFLSKRHTTTTLTMSDVLNSAAKMHAIY